MRLWIWTNCMKVVWWNDKWQSAKQTLLWKCFAHIKVEPGWLCMLCVQLLPVSNLTSEWLASSVFGNIPDATNTHHPLVPTVIKSGPILVPRGYWFSQNECSSNLFQIRKSITLYDIVLLYKLRSTNFWFKHQPRPSTTRWYDTDGI